jgi:hypothetical protein
VAVHLSLEPMIALYLYVVHVSIIPVTGTVVNGQNMHVLFSLLLIIGSQVATSQTLRRQQSISNCARIEN